MNTQKQNGMEWDIIVPFNAFSNYKTKHNLM